MKKLIPIFICALLPFVLGASMAILSSSPPAAAVGFDATTYGTVLAWYRAEDLVGADASSITGWDDHGTNNYDLLEWTGTNDPIIKTNIINGYRVARFDGSNDFLYATLSANCGTVIAVIGRITHTNANAIAAVANSTKRLVTFYPDAQTVYGGDGNEFWGSSIPTRVNGASTYAFPANPAFAVVSQTGTPTALNGIQFGMSGIGDAFNGDIVEVVFYSDQLSTANQDAAAAALMTKYGL